MAKKDTPKKLPHERNPSGKGGIHERPEDQAKGPLATKAVFEERKAEKIKLFREEQNKLKENLLSLAYYANNEGVKAKATKDILDYIAQGNPEGILEKSDSDEFGTLDEKLKQISDVYIEAQLRNQELERKVAKLEALLSKETPKDDTSK
jgi:hypothetical protein